MKLILYSQTSSGQSIRFDISGMDKVGEHTFLTFHNKTQKSAALER